MGGRIVSPELIGRDNELQSILAALDEVASGQGRTLLIGGEAGIGKSRLLSSALERARARGAVVLSGGCVNLAEGALPFAPIVEAIRPLLRERIAERTAVTEVVAAGYPPSADPDDGDELVGVAAELGLVNRPHVNDVTAELRPEWARSQLYERFLGLLRRLTADAPVVLAIEDMHWAGDSTRELLSFLARNARHERLLLLVTFRSDELRRRHPLLLWLGEADRLAGVERIEMRRLDRESISRQIAAILGRRPEPDVVDSIFARSEGNPFFAEELIASDPDASTLPPTLREVLAARLAHVSEPALRLLGVAAIIGRSVDHDLLARTSELSEEALEAALDEAISAQLLVAEKHPFRERYAFRHALLAEAAAESVLPGRRRRLHAAIATALTDPSGLRGAEEAGHFVEIAHHWFEARELGRAFEAALRAADATQSAGAYAEALGQYERALELWDVTGAEEASHRDLDRVELLRRAAHSAAFAGDAARAIQLLREAINLVQDCGNLTLEGLLYERLGRSLWRHADFEAAESAYRRAIELVPDDPPTADRARVLAGYAQVLMLAGHFQESIGYARRALDLARQTGSRQLEGHALCTLGSDYGYKGDPEGGSAMVREAIAIAEEIRDYDDIGRGYACLASVLDAGARIQESVDVSFRGAARMTELGMAATYGGFILMNAADGLITLGRWDEAWQLAVEQRPLARGSSRVFATQQLAMLAVGRGDWDTAAEALDELSSAIGRSVEAQFNGPMAVSRVTRAILTADYVDGRSTVDRVWPLLSQTEDRNHEARLLTTSLRLEADIAESARAARDNAGVERSLERGRRQLAAIQTLVDKAATGTQREAVTMSVRLAEAEASRLEGKSDATRWRAAMEAEDARGPVHDAAYTRYRLAEALLVDRAARAEAEEHLAVAYRTAVGLGARPLAEAIESLATRARVPLQPVVVAGSGAESEPTVSAESIRAKTRAAGLGAYGLSDREVDVLRLLAAGRTNRQIGEALFISESTAGVHVSHILTKLGVTGRVEAATIAARLGLTAA